MSKNASLLDRFLNWLRGDSGSIKSRFFYRPLERWDLFVSTKIKGESYTEWYRRRMNRMAALSNKAAKPVSQRYLDNAKIQVDYMIHKGMAPSSRVLEYGCGILRVGLHLVPYLEDQKYVAADISDLRIEKGVRILKEQGIDPGRYSTVVLTDATAKELGDSQFDFIMAHDVFAHMPLDECETCLISLKKHLADKGQLLVTFDVSDKPTSTNAKDYWFTRDQIARIAAAANFSVEEQLDWMDFKLPTQETQRMFRFVHPA